MQPAAHGRHRILAIPTLSGAVILTATLLLSVRAVASSRLSILYGTWSGTSMATPIAAGAAALVRQRLPNALPEEIADVLVGSGTNLDLYNPDYTGKLERMMNLGAALYSQKLYLPAITGG